MPAGDLEGDQAYLPGTPGHLQRTLDPAYVQDVDDAGPQGDGPADRDGMDEAAVEVVLTVDFNRWQEPRYGTRGQHRRHERPAAEPARARVFDAGRNAVEGQFEIGEIIPRKHVVQHVAQRLDRMQVRARTQQPGRPAPQRLAERLPQSIALPYLAQPCRRARRVGGHERAIYRAHRRARKLYSPANLLPVNLSRPGPGLTRPVRGPAEVYDVWR